MSNLVSGGVFLTDEDSDNYRLLYYPTGPFAGHVVGWNRMIFDGQETNAWRSCDFGTVEDACVSYPGLVSQIRHIAMENGGDDNG